MVPYCFAFLEAFCQILHLLHASKLAPSHICPFWNLPDSSFLCNLTCDRPSKITKRFSKILERVESFMHLVSFEYLLCLMDVVNLKN
mmetsp:Transcript_6079/g.8100  ORF Transcript_6079/g.8100 Transcript_6079/m.8100 type:complete len:87 (+) Transcript_6079:290-550(+)